MTRMGSKKHCRLADARVASDRRFQGSSWSMGESRCTERALPRRSRGESRSRRAISSPEVCHCVNIFPSLSHTRAPRYRRLLFFLIVYRARSLLLFLREREIRAKESATPAEIQRKLAVSERRRGGKGARGEESERVRE